jgi:hypothetical protein
MKTFSQFIQILNEATGLFGGSGKHVGDGVVFLDGPYKEKGNWTIASFDEYTDVYSAEQELVNQGYEVALRFRGPDKPLEDSAKIEGFKKGRIVVLDGKPGLLVIVYSSANASPGKFGMRYANSSESLNLKPQSLGIQEQPYSIDELVQLVVDNLDMRSDLSPSIVDYLIDLMEYYWNAKDSKIAEKIKREHVPALKGMGSALGQIKKNFGEIIGPIAMTHTGSDLFKDLKLTTRNKILYPIRGNEPLVDFYILKGNEKIPFSAKSGKDTTNTVKPIDILRLMNENPAASKKWGNSPEASVLKDLDDNVSVNGPMVAAYNSQNSIKAFKGKISKKTLDHWLANSARSGKEWKYVPELYKDLATSLGISTTGKNKPTFGEILYYIEATICKESAGGMLEFTEMFSDVVGPAVNYINLLSINTSTGIPEWGTSEGGAHKVQLRTKNGTTRIGRDKIGLQIKQ